MEFPGWECALRALGSCLLIFIILIFLIFFFCCFFFAWGEPASSCGDGWMGCAEIQVSPSSGAPMPGFWDLRGPPGVPPSSWRGHEAREPSSCGQM